MYRITCTSAASGAGANPLVGLRVGWLMYRIIDHYPALILPTPGAPKEVLQAEFDVALLHDPVDGPGSELLGQGKDGAEQARRGRSLGPSRRSTTSRCAGVSDDLVHRATCSTKSQWSAPVSPQTRSTRSRVASSSIDGCARASPRLWKFCPAASSISPTIVAIHGRALIGCQVGARSATTAVA